MPTIVWPAFPAAEPAAALGLLFQMESAQWLPPERIRENQLLQAEKLLQHAYATVPYYRERWREAYDPSHPLTAERFTAIPILARQDLQDHFDALKTSALPAGHGGIGEVHSSGSTGTSVRVLKTQVDSFLWNVLTLRDHLWHQRDVQGKLVAIRHGIPEGEFDDWGPATRGIVATGRSAVLGVRADVRAQLRWLEQQQPTYLTTYPSNAAELARISLEEGIRFPSLREVRTVGELLASDVRELCRTAWEVPTTDIYSSEETGYLALQCPQNEHYHVQCESVLLEILDNQGAPCPPGQVGRVVVTVLHNFAMPLVRYDLGDFAEVGWPCPCGRGLPVLSRVIGRVRNMLVTASGERYWPAFGARSFDKIAPIRQHQFVQKTFDLIEARLVAAAPLTSEQENALRHHMESRLPPGIRVSIVYRDQIPRSAGGKFEDFISEVATARG